MIQVRGKLFLQFLLINFRDEVYQYKYTYSSVTSIFHVVSYHTCYCCCGIRATAKLDWRMLLKTFFSIFSLLSLFDKRIPENYFLHVVVLGIS